MEQSFSRFGSPTFSSPVASQKRWKKRNKRKCSFGSLEKPCRKQFAQRKDDMEENRVVSSKFDNSLESDDIDFSSPLNWADEVEREESAIYTENARRKCGQERRTRKQLNMDKPDERNMRKKSLTTEERKAFTPMMNDPHRLSQRQKQIDMGKNTLGYDMYTKHVQRNERTQGDPWTPNKYQQCSTRSWQGQVKVWRRLLHMWDPEDEANGSEDPFAVSTSDAAVRGIVPISSGGSSQTSDNGSIQVNSSFDNELFGYFQPLNRLDLADNFPL